MRRASVLAGVMAEPLVSTPQSDREAQARLRFEDCVVAVDAPEPFLHWLVSFMGDACEETTAPAAYHVGLRADAERYDAVRKAGPLPGAGPAEGFAKDTGRSELVRWSCHDPSLRRYHDERKRLFYDVALDASDVALLTREVTRSCRNALMRTVRELVMASVVANDGLLLHAAAVSTGAGVIAFSGPKRSGKTTLLMSLLQHADVDYVSNDRCILRARGREATIHGLPTLVSIRTDLLDQFPAPRSRIASVRPDVAPDAARFSLSPPHFWQLMGGVSHRAGGPVRALVFPRVTDGERIELRQIGGAEALGNFRKGLFRANAPRLLGEIFVPEADASLEASAAEYARPLEASVVGALPCYELRLVRGRVPSAFECRELLEGLKP